MVWVRLGSWTADSLHHTHLHFASFLHTNILGRANMGNGMGAYLGSQKTGAYHSEMGIIGNC